MSNFNFQALTSMFGNQETMQNAAFVVALIALLLSWQIMLNGLLSEV